MNQEFQNEIAVAEENAVAEMEEKAEETIEAAGSNEPETPKKKSKAGKVVLGVVLGIVALVLVLAIAVGIFAVVMVNKATAETELPQKVEASSMADFGVRTIKNLFAKEGIVLENGDMQMLMDKVLETVSQSMEGTPVEIRDLYCVLDGEQGTICGKAYVSEVEVKGVKIKIDKELSFSATFNVYYEQESIAAHITELKCGELVIPLKLISGFISNVQLPEGLSIDGDVIYYNVSGLDAMVDDMLKQNTEEDSLGGLFMGLLAKETDLKITGAEITDGKLVIDGSIF